MFPPFTKDPPPSDGNSYDSQQQILSNSINGQQKVVKRHHSVY